MSWFKKQGQRADIRAAGPTNQQSVSSSAKNSVAKMVARPRSGTDPDTCLEVFKSHWLQAVTIMNKTNMAPGSSKRNSQQEDVDAVSQHCDQMMLLLLEEQGDKSGQGPILQFLLSEDILEKILTWSTRTGELVDKLRLHHIKMFDMLISQAQQPLLIHKPIIRPLLKLLSACAEHPNKVIEKHLILLLHQLCVCVTQNTPLLELLFNASSDQGPAKFLMFSLLIPYVHREGGIGQQARDALLLIMALSARHESIGRYIADNSDFCPVLATGLSGLYSSLPRKLNIPADDWHCLTEEDVQVMPDLIMFLNSLEFCNAVVQVAHPLVRDQLLTFIYNGFLVPVIGPALHQNEIILNEPKSADTPKEGKHRSSEVNGKDLGSDEEGSEEVDSDDFEMLESDDDEEEQNIDDLSDILKLPISLVESYFGNSMEEVIAATAYLDLFVRRITEPALISTFLKFILTEKHDDINILDSLITRISSNSRLCMVSLSLFFTLVDLNCEDVMFQLVFKYLIPCTHVMVSQRRSVKDLDLYSKTAEKFLSLTPACCMTDPSDTPPEGGATPIIPDSASSGSSSHDFNSSPPGSIDNRKSKTRMSFRGFRKSPPPQLRRSSSPDTTATGSLPPGALGCKLEHYETSYMEYLEASHEKIFQCARSCLCWSSPYDGENPAPDALLYQDDNTPTDDTLAGMDTEPSSTAVTPSASKTIESVFVEAQKQLSADLGSVAAEVPSPTATNKEVKVLPSGHTETKGGKDLNKETSEVGLRQDNNDQMESSTTMLNTDSGCVINESSVKSADESQAADDSRLLPAQRESCADSVTSEADSALSGSSSNTDHTQSAADNPCSRSDSPLNDNFDNNDFNAFLLSLKRVKTPVEFCDSIEESMQEIDTLIKDLKNASPRLSSKSSVSEPITKFTDSLGQAENVPKPEAVSPGTPTPVDSSTPNPARPDTATDVFPPLRSRSSTEKSQASTDKLSDVGVEEASSHTEGEGKKTIANKPTGYVMFPPLKPVSSFTKYNLGTPNIGPFLSALLSKLETMMANTLYVNLLLTGIITRLGCYPQPLLRSFLLNHSLVFQPTVKSLVQVLGSVKHKVDCYSYTVKDFESLLLRARRFLSWREEQFFHQNEPGGRARSATDINSLAPTQTRARGGSVIEPPKAEKKKTSMLGDLLFRRSPLGNKKPTNPRGDPRLQILGDGKGIRYINRTMQELATNDKMESVKTKNAVYCALVLEEFLKELAAVSQEHAVLSLEGGKSLLTKS